MLLGIKCPSRDWFLFTYNIATLVDPKSRIRWLWSCSPAVVAGTGRLEFTEIRWRGRGGKHYGSAPSHCKFEHGVLFKAEEWGERSEKLNYTARLRNICHQPRRDSRVAEQAANMAALRSVPQTGAKPPLDYRFRYIRIGQDVFCIKCTCTDILIVRCSGLYRALTAKLWMIRWLWGAEG